MLSKATLAKIHIAKKELQLDDETYRAMLKEHGGVSSAKELSPVGAARVLQHLERAGFKPKGNFGQRPVARPGGHALMDKVEALLADAKRPWSYAAEMAKHMFGVEKLEWVEPEQLHKLVIALQIDANRNGRGQ